MGKDGSEVILAYQIPLHKQSSNSSFIGKTIGEGTFGKVKLGNHNLTGEKVSCWESRLIRTQVAVKILEKDRIADVSDVERVAREIHILKLIRHPNIIQLYEVRTLNKVSQSRLLDH